MIVTDLLPNNRKDAMTADTIGILTGLSRRDVQRAVRDERRAGSPILADTGENGHGYWLWDGKNIDELRRYVHRVEGVALDLLETLKPLRQELKQLDNGGER